MAAGCVDQRVLTGQDGKLEWENTVRLLTLLFSPVQWTIAWLWVASPLSTKELLSSDICFSRDGDLLKRGELPVPAASSSRLPKESCGKRPSPRLVSNVRSTLAGWVEAPRSQNAGPASVIQAEAMRRKTQMCPAAESASLGRRGAMLRAVVALVSLGPTDRLLMLVVQR